jgi:mono/diheme cytochrome c family protein
MKKFICFSLWVLSFAVGQIFAAELKVKDAKGEKVFKTEDLLRFSNGKLTLDPEPVYKKKMTFRVVPLADFLSQFSYSPASFVEVKALDGFTSVYPVARLTRNPRAKAYLAIEEKSKPWPMIPKKSASAGPFYLIWENSKESDVTSDEWPYQVASFQFFDELKTKYPKIYPHKSFASDHAVNQGFEIFLKNCFVCHTMNGEGAASLGPDLNLPHNPTEYLKEEYMIKLIRNPQALRHFPKSQMSSFPEDILSDAELKKLLSYLRHMSEKKYSLSVKRDG